MGQNNFTNLINLNIDNPNINPLTAIVTHGGSEDVRGHCSVAYSCLGNYLSKYIWFIGSISNSFAILV
jgi:hypothetical protein